MNYTERVGLRLLFSDAAKEPPYCYWSLRRIVHCKRAGRRLLQEAAAEVIKSYKQVATKKDRPC